MKRQTILKIEIFDSIKKCEAYMNTCIKENRIKKKQIVPLVVNNKIMLLTIIEIQAVNE